MRVLILKKNKNINQEIARLNAKRVLLQMPEGPKPQAPA